MYLKQVGTLQLSDHDAADRYPDRARRATVPLRNGDFDHDGANVYWQGSRITRRFILSGERIAEQNDWIARFMAAPRQVALFELRDGRERVTWVKGAGISPVANVRTYKYRQELSLEWTKNYPFYLDNDHADFFDTGLVLDGSWDFDGNYDQFTFAASPYTFSINYNGSVDGRLNTVTIVPQAGASISNILLENLTNGMAWRYTGTVAAETRFDVDNATRVVMNDSTNAWEDFELIDDKQMDIMHLTCEGNGGNNFRLTGTVAGTVDLYFRWIGMFK